MDLSPASALLQDQETQFFFENPQSPLHSSSVNRFFADEDVSQLSTVIADQIVADSLASSAHFDEEIPFFPEHAVSNPLPDAPPLLPSTPETSVSVPLERRGRGRPRRDRQGPYGIPPAARVPRAPALPAAPKQRAPPQENEPLNEELIAQLDQQNAALEHQQAQNWFGTISHLEGRDPAGQWLPNDPQRYIDYRLPMDLLGTEILAASWQAERAASGFVHVQIFIKTVRAHIRFNQLNQFLGLQTGQFWWKIARSPPHAWDYCIKQASRLPGAEPHVYGERPISREAQRRQRQEDIVDQYRQAIEAKTPMSELLRGALRGPLFRNMNMFLQMRTYLDQPSNVFCPKLIYWIWGPTGADKTRNVREFADRIKLPYWKAEGTLPGEFFPGYDFQPVALFEEVRTWASVSKFLELCDGYETRQPLKLSSHYIVFRAKIIIISSEHPPQDLDFRKNERQLAKPTEAELTQIRRRIVKLPRPRLNEPYLFENHPVGKILQYKAVTGGMYPRLLPHLSNRHRASLGLPLISAEEETRQLNYVENYNSGQFRYRPDEYQEAPIVADAPRGNMEPIDPVEARRRLHALNGTHHNDNFLDDDLGAREPRGSNL